MKKSFKGFIACLMAALLVIPAFTGVFAEANPASINAADVTAQMKLPDRILEARQITSKLDVSGIRNGRTFKAAEVEAKEGINPTDIVTIMVKLDADPAVKVFKNLKGVNAQEYRAQLLSAQAEAAAVLSSRLNAAVEPVNNYSVLFNGFSFEGEYRLIGEINAVNGYHAFAAPEWGTPQLFNTVSQVHAVEAWDLDYTGEGQLIAIIDTGCKVNHPAFSNDPENPAYTQEQIAEILPQTHAAGKPVAQIYRSGKIPFGWNYQGNNTDIAHHYSDHGTHVAGIAAGNGGEIKGIAPDAQFAVMQVFAPTGGASFDTILLALEDAAVLGAVSANLSLGHICGDEDYFDPAMAETFDNVVEAGVSLSMSAGNEYNAAFNNAWGTSDPENGTWGYDGYALVENPDYGLVGGPSTGPHGMSVAAVQNSKGQGFYIQPVGGAGIGYIENEENMVKLAETLGGQTLEYVMVPGVGKVEDYEGIDVAGKVAFVQRGETNFVEKGYIAQDHGAVACIIWNNVPGEVLRMVPFGTLDGNNHLVHDGNEGKIPHVSITFEAGMSFMDNEDKHIFISAESGIFDAPGGNQPCDFSSWGVPSTMGLKPEIAAPGGQIYSSTDPAISGKLYDTWDGTSMAAPHISGGMAIIRQYVEEKFPELNPEQMQDMVNCILMSTATPLYDQGGSYASPRKQGAGEMNLLKAVTANAYITVEGTQGNRPKINLGDDPEKTGNYELTFTVHNFGEEELNYTVQPSVLLDEIAILGFLPDDTPVIVYVGYSWDMYNDSDFAEFLLGDADKNGVVTVSDAVLVLRLALGLVDNVDSIVADVNQDGEVTVADAVLAARIALSIEEGGTVEIGDKYAEIAPTAVTVPANGEAEVKLTLTLTDMAKEYIDEYYDSGAHIEGFIELVPVENETEPSLTVPFMGYYGDWNYPRTVGDGYYYEDICLNSNTYPNTVGFKKGKEIQPLGFNPFIATEDLSYYLADRNAISANGDKVLDTINLMYMDLERNSYVRYVVCDAEGNELGEIQDIGVCTKGFFDTGSMSRDQLGVNYCQFPGNYDFAQYGEDDLIIRIEAKLNNDGRHTTAAFAPEANKCWKWDIPLHLDNAAPEIDGFAAAEGKFTFSVIDEHYVAYAAVYTVGEENQLGELVDEIGVFETERGMATSIELNGEANNYVLVGDYAGNVSAYLWDGEELAPVEVEEPTPAGNFTEAHLFTYSDLTDPSAWVHFLTTDMEGIDFAEAEGAESNLFAAGSSYNPDDGKAYVTTKEQSGSPKLYKFDFDAENSLLSNPQLVGKLTVNEGAPLQLINEMAYFAPIGKFLGIERAGGLYIIDPATAQCTLVGGLGYGMVAMDASPEGLLYIIDENGLLHEVNLLAEDVTDEIIADTGIVPIVGGQFIFVQGGCLIGNTFYWHSAVPAGQNIATQLVRIDITSGVVEEMGFLLQDGFATAGLFGFPIN